jgi:1-acyl-sn-glycerol-3-phosphate acyltransferase
MLPRPPGYVPPPPPPLADAVRTARVALTDLLPYIARLAAGRNVPTTTTAAGLARIRSQFHATLDRLGIEVDVRHAERVPSEGGVLLFWNQESHLDHLVLPVAIPRPFVSLYNNEIARLPLYGAQMARMGHLHVDRTDEPQWRASVAAAAERARGGACVLVSPEGTRSWDGQLLPMKRGALLLATQSARPIVCVTVIGGHQRLPRGSPFVRRGPVRVVFSEPIATDGEAEPRLAEVITTTFFETKRRFAI